MRTYPETDDNWKDFYRLNAPNWMLEALKFNNGYNFWGPYEDYMGDKDSGWRSPVFLDNWNQHWGLDELNEIAKFYFEIQRNSTGCEACDGSGLNPDTKHIKDNWYCGERMVHNLEQPEVDALWEEGRLKYNFSKKPTAEEVNNWSNQIGVLGHDSINMWVCIKSKAKRLGVWGLCNICDGESYVYNEDKCRLALIMWFLHPRKGASRGVEIKNIQQNEMVDVIKYLKEARQRNFDAFSNLPEKYQIV